MNALIFTVVHLTALLTSFKDEIVPMQPLLPAAVTAAILAARKPRTNEGNMLISMNEQPGLKSARKIPLTVLARQVPGMIDQARKLHFPSLYIYEDFRRRNYIDRQYVCIMSATQWSLPSSYFEPFLTRSGKLEYGGMGLYERFRMQH